LHPVSGSRGQVARKLLDRLGLPELGRVPEAPYGELWPTGPPQLDDFDQRLATSELSD
jgi:hypothetical protein